MALANVRTDFPTVPDWQSSPRQTHQLENDKTVTRTPTDVHAKLSDQYSADGFGFALTHINTVDVGDHPHGNVVENGDILRSDLVLTDLFILIHGVGL
jgi:hypothetical protein